MKSLKHLALAASVLVISSNAYSYAIGTPWDKETLFRGTGLDADMTQCVAAFVGDANGIVTDLGFKELDSINLETLKRSAENPEIVNMTFNIKVKKNGFLFFPKYESTYYSLSAHAPNHGCLVKFDILGIQER